MGAADAAEIACSEDQKRALTFKGGAFALSRHCRGPKACVAGAAGVTCDQSVAEAGDACVRTGGDFQACSVDRKALLACEDAPKGPGKVYVVKGGCPTPKGCEIAVLSGTSFPMPVCDYRGQPEGSPCDAWSENRTICNPDKTGIFRCDPASHAWIPETSCKPNERCVPYSGDETLINSVVVCRP